MKSNLEFLSDNRIFYNMYNGEIDEVLKVAKSGVVRRRKVIFQPGDPADAVYWIRSGRIKIYKVTEDGREMIVHMHQSGDLFGEMAFVDDAPREYFAEAMEDLSYLAIRRSDLFGLAKRKPGIIYRFAKLIGERRREAETTVETLLYKGVRERLAGQLLKLSRDYGIEDTRGRMLRIKITHKDLASLIGSSRETVSLTLGDLRRVGLIDVNNDRKIIITDEKQLSQLA